MTVRIYGYHVIIWYPMEFKHLFCRHGTTEHQRMELLYKIAQIDVMIKMTVSQQYVICTRNLLFFFTYILRASPDL